MKESERKRERERGREEGGERGKDDERFMYFNEYSARIYLFVEITRYLRPPRIDRID